MKRIYTVYKAVDGKTFTDKKACRQYEKQFKPKLTKERLINLYSLLMRDLFFLANYENKRLYCSINQYRQKLKNNRDVWDYLSVKEGLSKIEFFKTYQVQLYGYTTLYLDPKLSIKQLVKKAKKYLLKRDNIIHYIKPNNDEKTIDWEIENYNKYRDTKLANKIPELPPKDLANQYKLTITDCDTGNVVQELYLPNNRTLDLLSGVSRRVTTT